MELKREAREVNPILSKWQQSVDEDLQYIVDKGGVSLFPIEELFEFDIESMPYCRCPECRGLCNHES